MLQTRQFATMTVFCFACLSTVLGAQPVPFFDEIGPSVVLRYPPMTSRDMWPAVVNFDGILTTPSEILLELPSYGTLVVDLDHASSSGSTLYWYGWTREGGDRVELTVDGAYSHARIKVGDRFFLFGYVFNGGGERYLWEHDCLPFAEDGPYVYNDTDLRLDIDYGPQTVLPGSIGAATFTITNEGPDPSGTFPVDCGRLRTASNRLPVPSGDGVPLVDFFGDCVLKGFQELGEDEVLFHFWSGELGPGESTVCTLQYRIHPSASQGPIVIDWSVWWPAGAEEANTANNDASMVLEVAAPARVPTLSPAGLAVLTIGLFLAFAWVRRRSCR